MQLNQNENVMIIDGENEIGLNEWNMEDEIMNFNLDKTKHNKRSSKFHCFSYFTIIFKKFAIKNKVTTNMYN
jgi:hypothetical protein